MPRNKGSTWNNQPAVNPLVVGSIPTQGATLRIWPSKALSTCLDSLLLIYSHLRTEHLVRSFSEPCVVYSAQWGTP